MTTKYRLKLYIFYLYIFRVTAKTILGKDWTSWLFTYKQYIINLQQLHLLYSLDLSFFACINMFKITLTLHSAKNDDNPPTWKCLLQALLTCDLFNNNVKLYCISIGLVFLKQIALNSLLRNRSETSNKSNRFHANSRYYAFLNLFLYQRANNLN